MAIVSSTDSSCFFQYSLKFLSDLYDLLHYAPNTETIQRARRKVQNKYKEFRPSKKIRDQRERLQDDYSDYGLAD